jgi:CheY-like chemotaxis protein
MSAHTQAAGANEGRRVLIVEDEALIAFVLEDIVRDLGYEVAAVASTLETAMATEPDSFDLAILDVQLNGMEVYPFAETLMSRGIPYIFASGNGRLAIPDAHRATVLLPKPFRQEALLHALGRMAQ